MINETLQLMATCHIGFSPPKTCSWIAHYVTQSTESMQITLLMF